MRRNEKKYLYVGLDGINNIDLGKEVGHVAYSSVILMLISVALLFGFPVYALESPSLTLIFWGAAISSALIACWYMRKSNNKMIMFFVAMIFGGTMVFLMMPVTANLPIFFGNKSIETFMIDEESKDKQTWLSEQSPTLTLIFHHKTEKRRLHGKGTQKEFTVYRGPLGLNSIPDKEYKSLHVND